VKTKVNIQIEKQADGHYLATSDNLQGSVAQVKTIGETVEIAIDVAEKLMDRKFWSDAVDSNPVFSFLLDDEEDIYSVTDGEPFNG
jgi:hypothetical protein